MTYARDHRRAVRKIQAKPQKGRPLRKWEQKRLEHDKGGEGLPVSPAGRTGKEAPHGAVPAGGPAPAAARAERSTPGIKSNSIPQTREELEAHLAEQIDFLRASAKAYDDGKEHEAKRLATPIRVLVYDFKKSRSLLGQLGLKGIGFFDTAQDVRPENLSTEFGIVLAELGPQGARFIAPLDASPRAEGIPVPFEAWWNKPVFRDEDRNVITRSDIVLAIANQDGGAHVDPELEARYAKLSRSNSLGWMAKTPAGEAAPSGPHLAALRQIAHELLKSLDRRVPPVSAAQARTPAQRASPDRKDPWWRRKGKRP